MCENEKYNSVKAMKYNENVKNQLAHIIKKIHIFLNSLSNNQLKYNL